MILALVFALSSRCSLFTGFLQTERAQEVVDLPLSAGTEGQVYSIPEGSIIFHKAGVTTVYGPERGVLLSIADDQAGIVSTPEGPARATHVHQVPSGSVVRDVDERTTQVIHEGEVILTVINEDEIRKTRGIEHEWLEYAVYPPAENEVSGLSVTGFDAYWEVPSSPPFSYWDTVDFFFPAIQDEYHNYPITIIQPVLEWNYEGNGDWTIASWTGTSRSEDPDDREYYRSEPHNVAEGDTIKGTIDVSSEGWDITIGDLNTDEYTAIRGQLEGIDNLWIFVVLEGSDIQDDSNVPGDTVFHDIMVRDKYGNDITESNFLKWDPRYAPEANNTLTDLKVRRYSEPYDDCPPRTIILETAN